MGHNIQHTPVSLIHRISTDADEVADAAVHVSGAVAGDHCSPISDTTIMASAGAQSNHVNHVSTQLPYALTAAAVSFVGYLIAGAIAYMCESSVALIALPITLGLMLITMLIIRQQAQVC